MDVKALKEILANVPDHAKVYRESDHGQTAEADPSIYLSTTVVLDYYGDEIYWYSVEVFDGYKHPYDKITAILIG